MRTAAARFKSAQRSAASLARSAPQCPDAGDIIKIEFDPQVGREFRGYHPALVLSPQIYNVKAKLCVLCPITSTGTKGPWEVEIPFGLMTGGVVIADQVKSLSWFDRRARLIERAPLEVMEEVRARLAALLQLDPEPAEDDA